MNAQDSLKNRGDGSREKVPDILQSRVMTGKKAPEKFRKLPDSIDSPPPSPPLPDATSDASPPLSQTALRRSRVRPTPSPPRPLRLPLTLLPVPLSSPPSSRSLPASFPSLLLFSVPYVARGPRPLRSPPAPPRRLLRRKPAPLANMSSPFPRQNDAFPASPSPPSSDLAPSFLSAPRPPPCRRGTALFPPGGLHSSSRRFPAGQ